MATASPPAWSLLLPTISSAPTYAIGRRAPRFLACPGAVSARRPLSTASLPKVAAPAAIEIPEEYEDEIEAVNIALDVTQVCGLFPPFYFLCFLDCIKLVACINRIR
jgi:cysteine synthase A